MLDEPRLRLSWKRDGEFVGANAVQHACDLMYVARNAYLHGARVEDSLLRPWSRRDAPALPAVAAVVFRTALAAYLQRQYPVETEPNSPSRVTVHFNGITYREAMAAPYALHARTEATLE